MMSRKFKDYLTESTKPKVLNELFIQANEISNMKKGKERDIQIARIGMIAELDASNLYENLSLLAKDKELSKALKDISNEEKVHAGEFEYHLSNFDPDWEESEDKGEEEAES